jgi:hypothetical protein
MSAANSNKMTRRSHYVPQFYLNNFAGSDKSLFCLRQKEVPYLP